MLAQRRRMEAFRAAIEAAGRPGDRVLEVGSGMATYAMFAARSGAGRVWAVEGRDIGQIARQVATTAWRRWSSCWRGGSRRLHLRVAPVHSPRNLGVVAPFGGAVDELYGLDRESSRDYAANTPLRLPVSPEEVIAPPRTSAEVALLPPPSAADLGGEVAWSFEEDAEVHGLVWWLDLGVGTDHWLSHAPGAEPGSWGPLLLPADRALEVRAGETLCAEVGFDAAARGEPDWTPDLLAPGRAAGGVLALADGSRSLDEIMRTLVEEGFAETRSQAELLVHRTLSARAR